MPQQEHHAKGKKPSHIMINVGPGKIAQLVKCANTGTQVQTSAPKLRKKIFKKSQAWANEMAQQVEVLAAKPDDLS